VLVFRVAHRDDVTSLKELVLVLVFSIGIGVSISVSI